jgi:hypothetical protein
MKKEQQVQEKNKKVETGNSAKNNYSFQKLAVFRNNYMLNDIIHCIQKHL